MAVEHFGAGAPLDFAVVVLNLGLRQAMQVVQLVSVAHGQRLLVRQLNFLGVGRRRIELSRRHLPPPHRTALQLDERALELLLRLVLVLRLDLKDGRLG